MRKSTDWLYNYMTIHDVLQKLSDWPNNSYELQMLCGLIIALFRRLRWWSNLIKMSVLPSWTQGCGTDGH